MWLEKYLIPSVESFSSHYKSRMNDKLKKSIWCKLGIHDMCPKGCACNCHEYGN